jgi:serine/threonine protein kinase
VKSVCPSCLLRIGLSHASTEPAGFQDELRVGSVIDSYEVIDEIGEGGMGIVYLAEQKEPVRRFVALKVIKPGMDTRQVLARFHAELQTLALMDHPGIAQVYDAGATEKGRPYFVMDWIDGVSLGQYLEEKKLGLNERLQLFIRICSAVQHAHNKGVIHCDLKPSNVLVQTGDDDLAMPKVIDFGIARAFDPEAKQGSSVTIIEGSANLAGTPAYMAPEQGDRTTRSVDTRADVYSLGAILSEMITGEPPMPAEKDSHSPNSARFYGRRAVDLDLIVLKATESDRERRYETTQQLSEDVARFLSFKPVNACPPSQWYLFSRFARRHRVPLAVSVVFALMLMSIVGIAVWQAYRASAAERYANERREQSEKLISYMLDDLYGSLKPIGKLDLLSGVIGEADQYYSNMPAKEAMRTENVMGRADVLSKAAWIKYQHADFKRAMELNRQARTLVRDLIDAGTEDKEVYFAHACFTSDIGLIVRKFGDKDKSLVLYQDAVNEIESILDPNEESYWGYATILSGIYNKMGSTRVHLDQHDQALKDYERSLKIREQLLARSPEDPIRQNDVSELYIDIAWIHEIRGEYDQAEPLLNQALSIRKMLPEMRPAERQWQVQLASAHKCMARLFKRVGGERYDDGFNHINSSVRIWEKLVSQETQNIAWKESYADVLNQKASISLYAERYQDGFEAGRDACAIWKELCDEHPEGSKPRKDYAFALSNFARICEKIDKADEALDCFEKALAEEPENRIARDGMKRLKKRLGLVELPGQ